MISKKVLKISSSIAFSSFCCGIGDSFADGDSFFSFKGTFEEAVKKFGVVFSFNENNFPSYLEKDLPISENLFKDSREKLFSYSSNSDIETTDEEVDEFSRLFGDIKNECEGILNNKEKNIVNVENCQVVFRDKDGVTHENVGMDSKYFLCSLSKFVEDECSLIKLYFFLNRWGIARDFCEEYIKFAVNCFNNYDFQNKNKINISEKDVFTVVIDNSNAICALLAKDDLGSVFDLLNEKMKPYIGDFSIKKNARYKDFCKEISEKYYNALFLNTKVCEFYLRFCLSVVKNTKDIIIPFFLDSLVKVVEEVSEPLYSLFNFFDELVPKISVYLLLRNLKEETVSYCKKIYSILNTEFNRHVDGAKGCQCKDAKRYENFFAVSVSKEFKKRVCYFSKLTDCVGLKFRARALLKDAQKFAQKMANALGLKEPTVDELRKINTIDLEMLKKLCEVSSDLSADRVGSYF